MQKNISVIIVANDNLDFLEKVIWSYNTQTFRNFEVIIVNSNSISKVDEMISYLKKEVFFSLICIDSNDKNTEKSYLKKAFARVSTNYVLISTETSLPRPDFLEQHIKNRVEGTFLVGNNFSISKINPEKITKNSIYTSQCFEYNWLKKNGLKSFFNLFCLTKSGSFNNILDSILSFSLNDDNITVSAWKSDFMLINDFENDIISQLKKIGLTAKKVKYKAVSLNLKS